MTGRIIKGISGFYYVDCEGVIFECHAKGIFRKNEISPTVGDIVEIDVLSTETGSVTKILPRKNFLVRPFISNLDILMIAAAVTQPPPDLFSIDKMCAIARMKDIEPILIFNKTDLYDEENYHQMYVDAGLKVFLTSALTGEGIDEMKKYLKGKFCAFSGVSGVGKSSILNALSCKNVMETGSLSDKIGRGKHTTRHVEIFKVEDILIADTPGFSTIDIIQYDITNKYDLWRGFQEFEEYAGNCKFSGCLHTCEKGCAILKAISEGLISASRYESYGKLLSEIKDLKEWENK